MSQTKVDGIEHLPAEKEFVEYALPKVPADLMARIVGFFRSIYRRQATEALVLLLWADEGFDCFVPAQKVSPVSVSHTLDETELPAGSRVIGSIHSHGAFGAWASSIDADDEAQFDGLHVVVGNFDRARPTYSVALAVDGQRFDIPTNVVLERPRRLVEPPEDWLQQVKLLPPPRPSRSRRARALGRTAPRRRSRAPCRPERVGSISTSRSSGPSASPTSSDFTFPTSSSRVRDRVGRPVAPMTERIVLIGLGGIGSQLLPSLVRYLSFRPAPRPLLVLVDGDAYEPRTGRGNSSPTTPWARTRPRPWPRCSEGSGLAVQAIAEFVNPDNVGFVVREGDLCLLAVDNHPTRALVDRHIAGLTEVTLISGGNDETDGNVQLVRRRDGSASMAT